MKHKLLQFAVLVLLASGVSLLLGKIGEYTGGNKAVMLSVLLGLAIFLLFLVFFVTTRVSRRTQKLLAVLFEQGDADTFIQKMEVYVKREPIGYFRELSKINLALGYSCKGEHKKAVELLDSVEESKLRGLNKILLLTNKIEESFYLCEDTKAHCLLEEAAKDLKQFENNAGVKANIEICHALYCASKLREQTPGEYGARLAEYKKNGDIQNRLYYYQALHYKKNGNTDKAKKKLCEIKQTNPSVELRMKAEALEKRLLAGEV